MPNQQCVFKLPASLGPTLAFSDLPFIAQPQPTSPAGAPTVTYNLGIQPPGECLQTGIALRAALVLAGLAVGKLVELVEQLAQGVPGDDRLAASEAYCCAGPRHPLLRFWR